MTWIASRGRLSGCRDSVSLQYLPVKLMGSGAEVGACLAPSRIDRDRVTAYGHTRQSGVS